MPWRCGGEGGIHINLRVGLFNSIQAILRAMKHGPHKKARELTPDVLAAKAGIHRAYIGVIERGDKGVGIDILG